MPNYFQIILSGFLTHGMVNSITLLTQSKSVLPNLPFLYFLHDISRAGNPDIGLIGLRFLLAYQLADTYLLM